mgnify:CR=1 FL=1
MLWVYVTTANQHDGTTAAFIVLFLIRSHPILAKIWADRAYRGFFVEAAKRFEIDVEIVVPDEGQKGFEVQPRRWVVERTFAWLHNYRRLSKDYEEETESSEAMIYAAMSHLMVRRLARLKVA